MSDNREQNNAVFGGRPSGLDPNIPAMTAVEKMKAELGVDLPVATVPLPSLGKCYPPGHALHGRDSVDIRAMTSREEDILMNKTILKKGTAVTELLKSCLVDRSIDPTTMLSGDRNALLVAIRITGYGEEYPVEIECSECDVKYEQTFDLASLPVRSLDIAPARQDSNYFEFVLPFTKKTVGFRFLTGQDEEEASATAQSQKKLKLASDSTLISGMIRSIVTLDGNNDRSRIAQFVRMMPARDSLALRRYMRENEPTIIFRQDAVCSACGHAEEVAVPLGVSFLWPEARR